MLTEKTSTPKLQQYSRATSPVPSAILQTDLKSTSLPKLPLPHRQHELNEINLRRQSFSNNNNNSSIGQLEVKPLVTHRSFPYLNSKSKYSFSNYRRGSDSTEDEEIVKKTRVYRYANDKRNNDFHHLFKSVPENERLIDDYGCALQKEILLQGRIYITEHHLCFNANIFGWITNLVIAFQDIQEIEKKTTAIFIPNAILITTKTSKHFLASFLSRDQAFDQMVEIWKTTQANNNNNNNNNNLEENEHEKMEESDDYSSSSEYSYSEDEDHQDKNYTPMTSTSHLQEDLCPDKQNSISSLPLPEHETDAETKRRAFSEPDVSQVVNTNKQDETLVTQMYEKTKCECDQHFPTVVMDTTYNSTIETIYNLLYNSTFMTTFLSEVEKSTDICIGEWTKVSEECLYSRESTYIKYLGGSIGPKSTKCYLKEEFIHLDRADYICQLTVTQTPDVPSGSSFNVKTRTCISWCGQGQVRVLVTVLVDFTKSSWLKSTIERASIDGQQNFYKNLDIAIRKYLDTEQEKPVKISKSHRRKKTTTSRRRHTRHRSNTEAHSPILSSSALEEPTINKNSSISDIIEWGISHWHTPSTSQLAVVCMTIMVLTNLYIALKMSVVDRQLIQLTSKDNIIDPTKNTIVDHEDTLWKLLTELDSVRQEQQQSSTSKVQLDRKISELEKIIIKTGYSMNQNKKD